MIYRYKVKSRHLTDTEKACLQGQDDIVCQYSPRQLKEFYCVDFQFPNGDTFPLEPRAVHLDSAEAID